VRELKGGGEPEAQLGDTADMLAERGLALLERLEQHRMRLGSREQELVLLRIEALVGDAQRLLGRGRLVGQDRAAESRGYLERLARLGERLWRAVEERLDLGRPDRRHGAELVAAEPVAGPGVADGGLELAGEPGEERVARRVTEGVVVALEPVQVEGA